MLRELTSRQLGEWIAFGMIEPVGNPVPVDKEAVEKEKQKQQRASFEGGMRNLIQRKK